MWEYIEPAYKGTEMACYQHSVLHKCRNDSLVALTGYLVCLFPISGALRLHGYLDKYNESPALIKRKHTNTYLQGLVGNLGPVVGH